MANKKEERAIQDKISDVNLKLEQAIKGRDEYAALVLKCQGALEVLHSMKDEKDD